MTRRPLAPASITLPAPGSVDLWRLSSSDGMRRPARALYWEWLDTQERARYQASADQGWREQFLTGHGWLREVLARYLGCEPARIALGQGQYGKPELLGQEPPSLHFNLSHTRGLLVLAVAGSPVGVDVEAHQPRDIQALSQRFFSADEQQALSRIAHPWRLACFYRLWTLKEAWVKASGIGIGRQWRQLRIALGGAARERGGRPAWRLASSDFPDGYSLAIAALAPRAISIRTFVDTALAGYGLCRDNLRWLEHHVGNDGTSPMRCINQGVTL